MNNQIIKDLDTIEKNLTIQFPASYRTFLSKNIKNKKTYEVITKDGNNMYLYNSIDIAERNKTYQIQDIEPNYFLIGQAGDLGFFIYVGKNKQIDTIYSLDLGAIGCLSMIETAKDIYALGNHI